MKKKVMRKRSKVSKKKEFSICGEYEKCWDFIKDSRNYIYIAILLFLIFAVTGFFFQDIINSFFGTFFGVDLNTGILNYVKQVLAETEWMGHGQLVGYIFFRNLQSSFLGMVFGIVLGAFPIISLISNGYLLGFVSIISVKANGAFVLWRLVPHGIFELPAVFISLGLGLRLGWSVFSKKEREFFVGSFLNSLRIFLLVIFPLLVIAAIIEATLMFFS